MSHRSLRPAPHWSCSLRSGASTGRSCLLAATLFVFGACDPDPRFDPACPSGTLGCPCLPDGTCDENEGECIEDVCVDAEVDEPLPPQDEGRPGGGGENGSQPAERQTADRHGAPP